MTWLRNSRCAMAGSMSRWRAGRTHLPPALHAPAGPQPMVGAQRRHPLTADPASPDAAGRHRPGGPRQGRWPLGRGALRPGRRRGAGRPGHGSGRGCAGTGDVRDPHQLEPRRVLCRIDSAKGPGTRARRIQSSSPCSPVARRSTRTSDGSVTDPRTALRAKSWAGVLGRDLSPAPSTRPDPWVSAGDDHLEGLRVCRATERVVAIHDGLEGEPVAHEHLRCEFSLGDQFEQHGRGGGAHQASGDRDALIHRS